MILLLGSNNKHKAKEIDNIFREFDFKSIQLKTISEITNLNLDVEESGETLEQNALLKARFYYQQFNLPTIADDTGLEVEVLNGLPGVISARFSGVHGNDRANRRKLLDMLSIYPKKHWRALFRTVICLFDCGREYFVEGICKGHIIDEERGEGGFGYDSIFVPDGYTKTFAEMTLEEKNSISHRSKAIRNLVFLLKKIYNIN